MFKYLLFCLVVAGVISCNSSVERDLYKLVLSDSIKIDKPYEKIRIFDNEVFAYNAYTKELCHLNDKFEEVDCLGGDGESPRENFMVLNYFYIGDDKMLIVDPQKNNVKIQDFCDSVHQYVRFDDVKIERVSPLREDEIFTLTVEGEEMKYNFSRYSLLSSDIKAESQLLDNKFSEPYSSFIYEGSFIDTEKYTLYYTYFSNEFTIIEKDEYNFSNYKYLKQVNRPKIKQIAGMTMLDSGIPTTIDAFLTNSNVYFISNLPEKSHQRQRVVDVYDVKTGSYRHSYICPELNNTLPEEIIVKEGVLYLKYENILYAFDTLKST